MIKQKYPEADNVEENVDVLLLLFLKQRFSSEL